MSLYSIYVAFTLYRAINSGTKYNGHSILGLFVVGNPFITNFGVRMVRCKELQDPSSATTFTINNRVYSLSQIRNIWKVFIIPAVPILITLVELVDRLTSRYLPFPLALSTLLGSESITGSSYLIRFGNLSYNMIFRQVEFYLLYDQPWYVAIGVRTAVYFVTTYTEYKSFLNPEYYEKFIRPITFLKDKLSFQ